MDDPDIALVERAYAALFADDIAEFLECWVKEPIVEYPARGVLPYGGTWRGRAGLERFLDRHDETEEILEFQPEDFTAANGCVFVQGRFRGRSKVSGRTWETNWIHVFGVTDGRLASWTTYFDTAAAAAAHRADDSSGVRASN